jgi:hypothetical protein
MMICPKAKECDSLNKVGCGHDKKHKKKLGCELIGVGGGCPNCILYVEPQQCPKGGEHEYGIDGMHLNRFCKKCFQNEL